MFSEGIPRNKISQSRLALRNQLWPEIPEGALWDRRKSTGFCTLPRTMPHLLQIMDQLSNRQPVSSTYLALWCRLYDESIVVIKDSLALAFEAGYTGQRAAVTWKKKMKLLIELGFIDVKPGPYGPYSFVLIWNPYKIVQRLREEHPGEIREETYFAFLHRTAEIGADDLS